MKNKELIKYLLEIGLVIAICSIGVRILSNKETLADYASANPEIAYASAEPIPLEAQDSKDDQNASSEQDTSDSQNTSDTLNDSDEHSDTDKQEAEEQMITKENSFIIYELSAEIIERITGLSYPADASKCQIAYDELRYLTIKYYDFNNEVQDGELICHMDIAEDLIDIFYELYLNEYQIEKIKLVDEYGADDDLSMADNNTSCFNYRFIANTTKLSNHSFGKAIDINPFYNPYVVFGGNSDGSDYVVPKGSESFLDRSLDFNHKIDKDDLCYKLFIEHGFTWGGDWAKSKDYQHFEKK